MMEGCWPSDTTFFLNWKAKTNVDFLHATLLAHPLSGKDSKTTLPSLKRSDIELHEITLPPFEEQCAIADVLRTVQRAKEQTEQVIAAARELKRSVLHHLFCYGPVSSRRIPDVILNQTAIGRVPAHWQVVDLTDAFESRLGKMLSPVSKTGNHSRPYLRNVNVQWGRVDLRDLAEMDFSDAEAAKFALRAGDALICEGGEVGRTAIWEGELAGCYFQKAIHRVRARDTRASTRFLMYHMMHAFTVARTYGMVGTNTTIAHLPGVKLKALPVPLPPRNEQDEIVEMLSTMDRKIGAVEQRREALDQLFKTLLHELMTGRIRLTDWPEVA